MVISNELFANLRDGNREGLRFILGHECAHIRLHHVALWYQVRSATRSTSPSWVPRFRGSVSTPATATVRPGAAAERGLVLLAAGRYAHDQVTLPELVDQGRKLGGFWVEVAQLNVSHPWTVRRLARLYQLGLFA